MSDYNVGKDVAEKAGTLKGSAFTAFGQSSSNLLQAFAFALFPNNLEIQKYMDRSQNYLAIS